ncbi:MAG: HAD family hydrolase [Dehalococcoidales bacterium]|nr:HAD family hydrolase [Dehalococcoidales bacterium]
MTETSPTVLWDFDGTLATRPGLWRSSLMEALNKHEPGHRVDEEQIRLYLRDGFPWHKPEESHLHLVTPDAWWLNLETVFIRAYQGVGFNRKRASELARFVREYCINPERFILYDDTIPALKHLNEKGWKHAILSNHVPELPDIVKALGLSPYIDFCITSAATGYEKPNPEAFRIALSITSNPKKVWMIGDNLNADIRGAEAVGLPAILVRNPGGENVKYYARNLLEAASIIEANI